MLLSRSVGELVVLMLECVCTTMCLQLTQTSAKQIQNTMFQCVRRNGLSSHALLVWDLYWI